MTGPKVTILEQKCTGCGACVNTCPFSAISVREGLALIDHDQCTVCGACISSCDEFSAIRMEEPAVVRPPAVPGRGDVWVFCEAGICGGSLASVSVELLGLARELAGQLEVRVGAVLVGHGVTACAAAAIAHGADRVYVVEHPRLRDYDDEPYSSVLARLVRMHEPEILVGGATAVGRALLPRVAVMVHAGLTADCTGLTIDSETRLLRQSRPAFGGNIMATITCETRRPQMATVRPGVLPRQEPDPERSGDIIQMVPSPEDLLSNLEWLELVPRDAAGVDLRDADVIVSAGYGTGGPEGVRLVSRFAKALGASLGASRAVVDAGWVDYPHQVGQTGTTVQPKLYVACGISGAIQHIVGMQSSDTIVAINRDPEAPVFEHADYALIGDLFDIIPELLRQLGVSAAGAR